MSDFHANPIPVGYRWRSSNWFILSTVAVALFGETFLYGFFVPLLGYMFQSRLHVNPSQIQELTSAALAVHGAVSVVFGPIIGHFADKTSNRKMALLLSLFACIVGTGMVAGAPSVSALFIGRVMQGIAGSSVWIVGLATVADTVGQDHMGTVMGVMMSFVNSGMISGPAVAGLLLEIMGYWATWSVPLLILTIDLVARLVMIESPSKGSTEPQSEEAENTSLLSSHENAQNSSTVDNFWRIMLCDSRVLTALLVAITSTTVGTSFHATLPLYVQETFGWGPGTTGFLFSCLIFPTLLISPLAGWVRDRVGVRVPAVASSILQAWLLTLLGIAGSDRISWASAQNLGGTLYIACIICLGAVRPFMTSVGPVELADIVKARQEETPGVFGPKGGLSRVFSMVEVAASLGTILGPIIGGALKEIIGYTYMSWTWSILYLILGVLIMCFLRPNNPNEVLISEEQC